MYPLSIHIYIHIHIHTQISLSLYIYIYIHIGAVPAAPIQRHEDSGSSRLSRSSSPAGRGPGSPP